MKARISCPHCGFTTWIEGSRIPAKTRLAVCPRCRERFPLRREAPSEPTPAAPERPGPTPEKKVPAPGPPAERSARGDRPSPEPPASTRGPSPWEERDRIGLWPAVRRSFVSVLFSPARFFRGLHHGRGLMEPFAVGLLFGSLGAMAGLFWEFVTAAWGLGGSLELYWQQLNVPFLFPVLLVLSPFAVAGALFVMSGILHLFLRVVRGANHGFEGTFRVVAYGQMTQILGAVPFLGGLIGGLWYMVVLVVGLREIHETSYARVILAFVLMAFLAAAALLAVTIPMMISLFR